MSSPNDTPIENRYPWLKLGAIRPELPENPTAQDYAKAYATMAMVYQAQHTEIVKVMETHRDDRRETLAALKDIRKHQTQSMPMPRWAKVHSVVLVAQAAVIGWLLLQMQHQQQLVERLAALHH